MTSGPAGIFGLAPLFLAGYLLVALISPAVCQAMGRAGMILLALLPAATTAWAAVQIPAVLNGGSRTTQMQWVPSISLAIDLRLDALAMVMTLVIAGIGTLVLLYSARYFPDKDEGLGRYSGSLIAFAGAMLGLVWANNLILLVVFWELTGILSYLLIAHRTGKRSSRAAASQALMVTTAGGLVMLIGVVMLGVTAGTFTLSDILANPPSGPLITTSIVLMIVGGISKSAIIPFQFWLPGAMAAPTPASAYLHAATMVKAGIYLFARLAPAFAILPLWQPLLMTLGGGTMLFGAVIALRQRDLKLLLAYGTVSQLGLMTLLIGCGNPDALLGGLAMLIAHATFKAPLFFVVGIIDTSTGTRDLTKLSGLRRSMPVVATMAVLAAISMAGIPPMLGFAAKEAGYAGLLDGGTAGYIGTAVMAVGSAFTVAYSARFLWGAFADKPGVPATAPTPSSPWMTGPDHAAGRARPGARRLPGAAGTAAAVLRANRGPDARGRDGALARARAAAGAVRGRLAGRRRHLRGATRPGAADRDRDAGRGGRRRLPGDREGGRRAGRRRHRGDPAQLAAGVTGRDPAGADRLPRHHADPGRRPARPTSKCWASRRS